MITTLFNLVEYSSNCYNILRIYIKSGRMNPLVIGGVCMIFFTTLYLTCGIIYLILGIFTYLNDKKSKLNEIFLILCIFLAYWAFMFALENQASSAINARNIHVYSTFSWSFVHCLFLHLVIILTGNDRFFRRKVNYIIFYFPALFSIYLYFFQPPGPEDFTNMGLGWVHRTSIGRGFVWTNFFNIYYFSYMTAVTVLLFLWWRHSKIVRERKQGKLIMITVLIAIISGGFTDIVIPMAGFPIIPSFGVILVMIPIIGIWYSIKKYKLMDLNPENFGLDVLRIMNEGLIIIDQERIIKYVNNGAMNILGYKANQLKDKSVSGVLLDSSQLPKLGHCSSLEIELLQKNGEGMPVLLSSTFLKDEWGDTLGTVGIFQDISEIKMAQNQLKKSHDELELKVKLRTLELSKSNKDLEREIAVRFAMQEKIKKLAYYDHLTGLPNRTLFNDRLNQGILDSLRIQKTLGVLFLDLDSFKRVNDTMGHAKGDELLKMVADRLVNTLRKEDTICRVGGDEFLILIQNLDSEYYVEKTANKILDIFIQPFILNKHEMYITTSIGGAIYPTDGSDVDSLVKNADIAMYTAKANGKNNFQICTHLIKSNLIEEMKLTNSLYHALERNELELYYQPQVDSISGKIIGLEALIRWNNPELGIVNPGKFIYIAEKTGLILHIGEWVINSVCKQYRIWQNAGIYTVPIAINLSVTQFQNTNIVELITRILKETGMNSSDLELEITESIIMKETEYIIEVLEQLKQLGVKIAIDDFGTEYSSLNYIKQLPVDKIKIDMSFIKGINKNVKDEAIIKVIIALAKNLGLKVIAEGVETKEQLDFLCDQLCDEIQGYFYYKPMTAPQIEIVMGNVV